MTRLALLFSLLTLSYFLPAQVQKAKLPRTINVPTKSHIYPSLTSDEKYMLFYSNYSNTGNYELKYTKKTGRDTWAEPEYIENILKPHNDHFASFNVSPDGKYLLFSSYRAGGIGKYDILISERVGDQWSQPKNPGKPLNSPGNEGNPSMSPDGRSIYFMRCETMDDTQKSGCKIFVSHKRNKNVWGEPEELPSYINTGNSTSPKILSDNETLIFSSERPGNKGKLDLYMTHLDNGIWSQPVPLDIINTVRNDEFVSVPARGDVIYYTDVSNNQFVIAMALLPQELRPKKVLLLSGKVQNVQPDDKINIQSYDANTGELITSINLEEGESEFNFILAEGRKYDFSIFPVDGKHTYFSKIYNLEQIESSDIDYLDFTVEPLLPGKSLFLPAIQFDTIYHQIKKISETEFRRVSAIMQKNPDMHFEFGVYTSRPLEKAQFEVEVQDTTFAKNDDFAYDEVETVEEGDDEVTWGDLHSDEFIDVESEAAATDTNDYDAFDDFSDTSQADLEKSFQMQTQIIEKVVFDPIEDTQKYAELIRDYLIQKGVPPSRFSVVGYGNAFLSDLSTEDNDMWVEMKVRY